MKSPMIALALAAGLTALATVSMSAGAADCNAEVAAAFQKQRAAKSFRMATNMVDERGVVLMTVDYELPFKMRQTVQVLNEKNPKEVILVGDQAWSKAGGDWEAVREELTQELVQHLKSTVVEPGPDPLDYRCQGEADIQGRKLKVFEGRQPERKGENVSGIPVRRVFVDPETGLPVRSEVAPVGKPDVPFFRAAYSYPKDLAISPPAPKAQ
ncbi:MAG: hypothetical protein NW217_10890 [Hyphomicrobiaceae bacterium]|nr:hypothetical protein [Hyphomicrobiaceae bacterium]